jgi:hypothetical protein
MSTGLPNLLYSWKASYRKLCWYIKNKKEETKNFFLLFIKVVTSIIDEIITPRGDKKLGHPDMITI